MLHLFATVFLPLITYLVFQPAAGGVVLGDSTIVDVSIEDKTFLADQTTLSVKTSFAQKTYEEIEEIPFETNYQDAPDIEYGEEEILEAGKVGTKTTRYTITYWFDEELNREISDVEIVKPVTQKTAKGTKVVWRELDTGDGKIKYWRKLHVWATKYDGNCLGCRGLTYSGTLVRKGVCAVDPKVIPLGTNFWVQGYGMCRSEDIGGGVKGNHVDLGYEDVSKSAWRTGFTDVYLMTSFPE